MSFWVIVHDEEEEVMGRWVQRSKQVSRYTSVETEYFTYNF